LLKVTLEVGIVVVIAGGALGLVVAALALGSRRRDATPSAAVGSVGLVGWSAAEAKGSASTLPPAPGMSPLDPPTPTSIEEPTP
jgi:hypothetical protein